MDNNFIFIQLLHLHIMCAACFREIPNFYRPQFMQTMDERNAFAVPSNYGFRCEQQKVARCLYNFLSVSQCFHFTWANSGDRIPFFFFLVFLVLAPLVPFFTLATLDGRPTIYI